MRRNKKKTSTAKYVTTPKIEPPPAPKYSDDFPEKIYTLIPRKKYADIPLNTHIGYRFYNPSGTLQSIKSGFIMQHLITASGAPAMNIVCGNRVWLNLYDNMPEIYYFTKEKEKIREMMNTKPNKTVDMTNLNDRIGVLEKKMDILLRRSI